MSGCYDMSGGPMDERTRAKITALIDAFGGPGDDPELKAYYEGDWHPCPDCGCQCSPAEWSCWRCGAVQDEVSR